MPFRHLGKSLKCLSPKQLYDAYILKFTLPVFTNSAPFERQTESEPYSNWEINGLSPSYFYQHCVLSC